MKTILAHLNGTGADEHVLAAGGSVARLFGSHIDCLYVAPDPEAIRIEAAQVDMGMSAAIADIMADFEKHSAKHRSSAQAHFSAFCKEHGIEPAGDTNGGGKTTASFRETIGDNADALIAAGRYHDLLILAGGPERDDRLSSEDLGNVVVGTGRPVLLVPERHKLAALKTIALAWKPTPESARAVTAAMPLLEKAEHIHVLSANEDNSGAVACLECSDAMTAYLRRHGFNANCHFVIPAGRSIADAIVETARHHGADLVVMGGYGHGRLRELVLGGFTRHVLAGVPIPVLMVH